MYKLAVLDIDGTIVPKRNRLSPAVKETIAELTGKLGVPVCLCTGRPLVNTLPIAAELGLKTHAVTVDGAVIYSLAEKKTVAVNTLRPETYAGVIEDFQDRKLLILAQIDDEFIHFTKYSGLAAGLLDWERPWSLRAYWSRRYWHKRNERYVENLLARAGDIRWLAFQSDCGETLDFVAERLAAADYGEDFDITRQWPRTVEISKKGVNKASGMLELCRIYNAGPGEAVAIGDDVNDVAMLKAAGMGVAMGNAAEKIKAAADYITESIENDGAAIALRKFFW